MQFTYGKGGTLQTSIYPINSRPTTNIDPNVGDFVGPKGKANPMKHWRKQLQPYYTSHSKQITINQIENPSISILTDIVSDHTIYNELLSTNHCIGTNTTNGCVGGSHNIRRSGSTIVNPNYCTSTKQYLQKRCKTFDQNQKIGKKIGLNQYKLTTCSNTNTGCPVIYKPSNTAFQTQGGVTAEGYTAKIKEQSIEQNPYNPSKKLESICISYTNHK